MQNVLMINDSFLARNDINNYNVNSNVKCAVEYVKSIFENAIIAFKNKCSNDVGVCDFADERAIDVLMQNITKSTDVECLSNALVEAFHNSDLYVTEFNFTVTEDDCGCIYNVEDNTVDMINTAFNDFYNDHKNDSGINDFMMNRAMFAAEDVINEWMDCCDVNDIYNALDNNFFDNTYVGVWEVLAKVEYVDVLENVYNKYINK